MNPFPNSRDYIPKPPPKTEKRFETSVVAQVLADLIVAEGDVQGPLLGRHVAAVLRQYFGDVRDVWSIRDQLTKDGYWELLETQPGEATPGKRLTPKGQQLGATVPARITVEAFHRELEPSNFNVKRTANEPKRGTEPSSRIAVRRAQSDALVLLAVADFHELEKATVDAVPLALVDRVFKRHFPKKKTGKTRAKVLGWMKCVQTDNAMIWNTTPEGLIQITEADIKPTLTPEEINSWLIEFGLRQPEPPAKPKVSEPEPEPITVIKVPYGQWLAYVTFRRLLEILVTDYNWPVADRLPIQLLHETLFSLEPATPHGLSSRLTKMRENGLVAFLGCVGRGSTVWQIKDVKAEPVNQRGARPKLTDADLQLVIGNILFRRQQVERFHDLITKRYLGRY